MEIIIDITKIDSKTLVLTANKRLSATLHDIYNEAKVKEGQIAWHTVNIIPLNVWINKLYIDSNHEQVLLGRIKSLILWEDILRKQNEDFDINSTVIKKSYDAFSLLNSYLCKLPTDLYLTKEALSLKKWMTLYKEKLKKENLIDSNLIFEKIIPIITDEFQKNEEAKKQYNKVIFAGFLESTPQIEKLKEVFISQGVETFCYKIKPLKNKCTIKKTAGKIPLKEFDTIEEEVRERAKEIRQIHQRGMTIGVVIPDMNRYKDIVIREFKKELNPETVLNPLKEEETFNITLGSTLTDEKINNNAIDLLKLKGQIFDTEVVINTLFCPYIYTKNQLSDISSLDFNLRDYNHSFSTFKFLKEKLTNKNIQKKLDIIESYSNDNEKKPINKWAEAFDAFLNGLNYSKNEMDLSHKEFKAFSHFKDGLQELTSLKDLRGDISKDKAITLLIKILENIVFQIESESNEIEVIGPLEAFGKTYDMVYILGLDEETLPSLPSPNPFIPIFFQKEHSMTRSSFDKELNYGFKLLESLLLLSDNINFSYAKNLSQKTVEKSPLIKNISRAVEHEKIKSFSIEENLLNKAKTEEIDEEKIVALDENILKNKTFSTRTVKNQSLCPFKAFSEDRLYIKEVQEFEFGLNQMERGSIFHKSMELFWGDVKDKNTLDELVKENELTEKINFFCEQAFKDIKNLSKEYLKIEKEHISLLMRKAVEQDLQRENFRVIEREKIVETEIEDVFFKFKIDRVDELRTSEQLLIDYKTGTAKINNILGARPKEPQMLLYNLLGDYSALAFSQVKLKGSAFLSIAKDKEGEASFKTFNNFNEIKEDTNIKSWDDLQESWNNTIINLIKEFKNGHVEVNPLIDNNGEPCKYCNMESFCRIFEKENTDNI